MARVGNPLPLAASVVAIELITALVVATRPSTPSRLAIFGLILTVAWIATGTFTVHDTFRDYGVGSGVYATGLFTAVHFFFMGQSLDAFANLELDGKKVKDRSIGEQFKLAFALRASIRGIGWGDKFQTKHVPEASILSRWPFVRSMLLTTVKFVFMVDLAGTYIAHNPIFSSHAHERQPITSQGLFFQTLSVFAWWTNVGAVVQMLYSLVAALAVGAGLWEPKSWPPMFGKFSDAYTLRRFWGRVWHQILRRYVASIGLGVCSLLGVAPHTNASSYTQLYVGFLVSGLVHAFGDRMVGMQFGRSVVWFLLQAVAITIEDGMVALGNRAGFRVPHVVGWLWVATWAVLTTPLLTSTITAVGAPLAPVLPFSPIQAIWSWSAAMRN